MVGGLFRESANRSKLPSVPLLECVPNVSEGRRSEVICRLARAVAAPGVFLLDQTSDPDHNRTVFTLAGEPAALQQGMLRLYEAALSEIDLGVQRGVHPRVGAVDVVPFVPLAGSSMEDAAAAARELGREVGWRFSIPVFLYEQTATRPHRRSLAEVRRGGLEGLVARLANEPAAWAPDFGPPALHPRAGATVIGARFFLVAFNVVLDGGDLAVAREVARAVRASNGGLAAVRAIGVYLPSRARAQVSMNLLDYRVTSLPAALARVEEEAAKRGARIAETELIGLIPEAAAREARAAGLDLPALAADRILENALAAVRAL